MTKTPRTLHDEFFSTVKETDSEPQPDIAICTVCETRTPVTECPQERDGDWESGYFMVHVCPVCEDGGCIDDYGMSEQQLSKWDAWSLRQPLTDKGGQK